MQQPALHRPQPACRCPPPARRQGTELPQLFPVRVQGTPSPTCPGLFPPDLAHLQTLGGALMGPSVLGVGGATEVGQKLLRVSTNPGEVAAVLGKAGAARFAR